MSCPVNLPSASAAANPAASMLQRLSDRVPVAQSVNPIGAFGSSRIPARAATLWPSANRSPA